MQKCVTSIDQHSQICTNRSIATLAKLHHCIHIPSPHNRNTPQPQHPTTPQRHTTIPQHHHPATPPLGPPPHNLTTPCHAETHVCTLVYGMMSHSWRGLPHREKMTDHLPKPKMPDETIKNNEMPDTFRKNVTNIRNTHDFLHVSCVCVVSVFHFSSTVTVSSFLCRF